MSPRSITTAAARLTIAARSNCGRRRNQAALRAMRKPIGGAVGQSIAQNRGRLPSQAKQSAAEWWDAKPRGMAEYLRRSTRKMPGPARAQTDAQKQGAWVSYSPGVVVGGGFSKR